MNPLTGEHQTQVTRTKEGDAFMRLRSRRRCSVCGRYVKVENCCGMRLTDKIAVGVVVVLGILFVVSVISVLFYA